MDEFQKKVREIKDKVNTRGLVINRVPKNTHEEFLKFAEEEFCDDFGMCLKHVWDNFKMWQIFFQNMDMKLDVILERMSQMENKEESSEKSITTMSGRRIAMKGGNK